MSARSRNLMNQWSQPGCVICDAAGCVQVDRLERTHKRPTPSETVADSSIDLLADRHSVSHQGPCFAEKGCLQPVQHKALNFLAHMNNAPFERAHERVGKLEGGRR